MQKHGLDDLSDLEVVPTYGHTQEISQKGPKKNHTRSERFGCMAWLKSSQTQPQLRGITLHRATNGHGDVRKLTRALWLVLRS